MEQPPTPPEPKVTFPIPGLALTGLAAVAALLVGYAITAPDFTSEALALAAAGITVAVIIVQAIDGRAQQPKLVWSPAERRRAGFHAMWAVLVAIAATVIWILLWRPSLAAALTVLLFGPFLVLVIVLSLHAAVFKGRVSAAKTR